MMAWAPSLGSHSFIAVLFVACGVTVKELHILSMLYVQSLVTIVNDNATITTSTSLYIYIYRTAVLTIATSDCGCM